MKKPRPAALATTAAALTLLVAGPATATKPGGFGVVGSAVATPVVDAGDDDTLYDAATLGALRRAIRRVEAMPENSTLQTRAQRLGLNVINVLWEDTGRYEGSSVGPNISDVTLQLREPTDARGTRYRSHLLPVLRHPNFTDKTADVAADKLWVKVGNQSRGAQLVSVPLSEVLKHLREYVTDGDSILGSGDLSAPRDSHYLVSAQHVFVPIAERGKVEFTPVIFNYQSSARHPAVLTLLVTRQGTSVVAIDNTTDAVTSEYTSGQALYFNHKGQKTTLTAERKSTVKERIESGQATAQDEGALDEGADLMLIVQVPLKVRTPARALFGDGYGSGIGGLGVSGYGSGGGGVASAAPMAPTAAMGSAKGRSAGSPRSEEAPRSDVEQAVLGHGDDLGAFSEGRGLKLERDPRFPVRVTVQFYKATSNGVVTATELADAKRQIDRVYAQGDFVGSLVVPESERSRPTDWHLGVTQPVPVVSRHVTPPVHDVTLDDDAHDDARDDVAQDDDAQDDAPTPTAVAVDEPSWLEQLTRWLVD
ncbi:MAG: hypothetical protein FJ137_12080 [Deltaproteobacteria bacterium]|nr:hypothetical protein [Deltaproteobacteria bacterium]